MEIPFFDLKNQINQIKSELIDAIEGVIKDGVFILGPRVENLEKKLAEYCECKYAIAVASGTDALHLSLRALGIGQGDEVITTPFSFIATAEAISYTGATPVFADIDEKTFNINPDLIEEKITSKTKAVLPVHLYGQPADMEKILKIAQKHSLKVIEDCAQAIGAKYQEKKVGSLGDVGCFSFFPTKNLGAFGDGGLVVTNNEEIAKNVRMLRAHGGLVRDDYQILGFNSRLDVIQAVILDVKLKYLDNWNKNRRNHAYLYNELLRNLPLETPYELPETFCVYNQYTLKVKERKKLMEFLKSEGISTMIYYPRAIHLQKIYENLKESCPVTEKIQEEVISLPIFPELNPQQIQKVADSIRRFYQR